MRAQQATSSVTDTADRPGFADSPTVLGRGHVQVESGFSWEIQSDSAGPTRTFTWPEVEIHAGVTPRIDVSLTWDGLVSTVVTTPPMNTDGRSTGGADVRLGAKFGLVSRPHFDIALIAYAYLPVGSESVSSDYADPQARFTWAVSFSDRLALWGTADMAAEREDDRHVRAKPAASASLGTTIVKSLNGFVGIIAEPPPDGSTPHVWSVEAGLVLPVGDRHQIDVWVNHQLDESAHHWFVGAGFVRRLR
jgi:hypothetical protein